MLKRERKYFGIYMFLAGLMTVILLLMLVYIAFYGLKDRWLLYATIVVGALLLLDLVGIGYHIYYKTFVAAIELDRMRDESDAFTREVISNITHDLKTPLTAIKGYSQGIIDGIAVTPAKQNKYITTIRNKADDMSALVDELSFFASIYKNDLQYVIEPVNANQYISDCLSNLSLDLETKKILLVFRNMANPNILIDIDKEKMKRVINNIVGNAAKYIGEKKGIVYVTLEETEFELIVHVEDNGIGIEEMEIPYIFNRFYRTDSSRNSATGGSGLGLAICRKIVEDHNGEIWAESKVGKGTRISFSLSKYQDEGGIV